MMPIRWRAACFALFYALLCSQIRGELGKEWSQATSATAWSGRNGHTSLVYGGRIWIIGGYHLEDVWSSPDGSSWTQTIQWARFGDRYLHASLVYNGKMWVIGGYHHAQNQNDIWSSSDGVTWTTATLHAAWSPRYGHTSVVHSGKMWVLGGGSARDVWSSSDGVKWTSATVSAPWQPEHTSVVYQNKIWVICSEGVWSSSDGTSWTLATAATPWRIPPVYWIGGMKAVACDGKIWVMGGQDYYSVCFNAVWCSTDGKTWVQVTPHAAWIGRVGHAVLVHDGKIWVLGGYTQAGRGLPGKLLNDVWYSAMPTPTRHWRLYP